MTTNRTPTAGAEKMTELVALAVLLAGAVQDYPDFDDGIPENAKPMLDMAKRLEQLANAALSASKPAADAGSEREAFEAKFGVMSGVALVSPDGAQKHAWQPIETAPKDGTVIDLWVGGEFAGRRASCYWGKPEHECGEHGRYCDSDWHDLDDGWVDDFNMPLASLDDREPTHWMPLPAAPAALSQQQATREDQS